MSVRALSAGTLGVLAAMGANLVWGLNPLYFHLLDHVPAPELLAHRVLWGAAFVLAFCLATGRGGRLAAAFADRAGLGRLAVTAALITVNWFVYLAALQAERVTEAGFGYYLMPLVSVALGVVVLGERLGWRQWLAVGFAAAAVAVLAAGLGGLPVISVAVATSFALYGFLRKRMEVGAIVGFAVEALLIAPLALAFLLAVHGGAAGGLGTAAFGGSARDTALLVLAGPVTGLPLILFAEAARRLAYSTLGIVQYANPTLQIACGVLVLGEPFGTAQGVALALIWAGLALYSAALMGNRTPAPVVAAPVAPPPDAPPPDAPPPDAPPSDGSPPDRAERR